MSANNHLFNLTAIVEYVNPCSPSPCGPNSQCRETNGQAVCSCLPNYVGSPPGCRPECVVSSECSFDKACTNQKCTNPCTAGTCGSNAACRVNNHSPICSCNNGFQGNPFTICNRIPRKTAKSKHDKHRRSIENKILSCSSTTRLSTTRYQRSLLSFSVWSILAMSKCKWWPFMLLSSNIHWCSS